MKTIVELLHSAAERYPERAYATMKLNAGWVPWTYADIDRVECSCCRIICYWI